MVRKLSVFEIVSLVCASVAIISTVARLFLRRRRLWVDDAWAFFALLVLIVQFIGIFTHPRHSREGVARYYVLATTFYTIIWSARLSLLFSLIRVDPHTQRRQLLFVLAAVYIILCILLVAQLFWTCEPQQGWKSLPVPQCHIELPLALFQLITDVIADGTLLIVPLFLFRILNDTPLRYLLMAIFSTCIITTVVSLIHAVYVLTTGGVKEEIAAIVEDCASLVVCNIPVIAPALLYLQQNTSVQQSTNLLSTIVFHSGESDPETSNITTPGR
ncbi:hypothetical protein AX15_002686 [Amanita polypyramis BW_CC]|nr:hypothetical protein AX15_002686 [Amanita polypyramis BW_CC]